MNINNYLKVADSKIKNKYSKTIILAILSGILLSFAALGSTVASAFIENYSLSKFLAALIFPMGLILIILLKTELFTGNSLLIIPLLEHKISIKELLRNYILVYIGNVIGSIIIALLISKTPLMNKISSSFVSIMNNKISLDFITALILGILCNFLVCMAVYLSGITSSIIEKVIVIFIPIFLFIILSLEHSVANMFYLSIGYILDNSVSISTLLLNNLLPVTIGNIVGGMTFGGIIWYLREQN